jgi:hypothetical protein
MDKFINKNILILGAGTSTLDVKWENLEYDYIWTCNDFYISERLSDTKIDLALIGYNTDIQNTSFRDRLRKDDPMILIEPYHYREKVHSKELKEFSSKFDVFWVDIPFNSIAGAAARLVKLALMCSAKNIYFAGVDGFNRDFSNAHAFTGHVGLKDTDTRREYEIYHEGFINCFKEYLNDDYSCLQNLGEGYDYNCGTEISEKHFPLRQDVYNLITKTGIQ